MSKRIGVQKELNEIAEALTVNGFEVTDNINELGNLDAIIYYNDESNMVNSSELTNMENIEKNNNVLKINASKTNITQIINQLKGI